jgi:uncharacterized protein (TIGR00730 family)
MDVRIPTRRELRSVAVFCGSNLGADDGYRAAAAALGAEIGRRGLTLVYGGTHKGLMGILADAALNAGAHVTGIITRRLADKGHLHPRLTGHEITADMRSRKARMLALADACIALPGGISTVEEFMEAWTLNQLGDVDKPVGLYNVDGFFTSLLAFVDGMIERGFLPAAHRDSLVVGDRPEELIEALVLQPPITVSKWMS